MGIVCQKTKNYEDAANYLEKAVKVKKFLNSHVGNSVLLLGECYYKLKKHDQALENLLLAKDELKFDEVTDYKESQELCLCNIASIYEKYGDVDNCVSHLEFLINYLQRSLQDEERHEKVAFVWKRCAGIYFKAERYDESIEAYSKCLVSTKKSEDESKLAPIFQKIGLIHYICERYDMAYDYHEQGLDCSNDMNEKMSIQFELGRTLSKLNRIVEAFDYYQKSLIMGTSKCFIDAFIASTVAKCVCELGALLIEFGETDNAIHHYENTLKALNNDHYTTERLDVLMEMSNAYLIVSNTELALSCSLEAKKIVLKDDMLGYEINKKCFFLIASVYEQMDETIKGIDSLEELIYYARTSISNNFQREVELAAVSFLDGFRKLQTLTFFKSCN